MGRENFTSFPMISEWGRMSLESGGGAARERSATQGCDSGGSAGDPLVRGEGDLGVEWLDSDPGRGELNEGALRGDQCPAF